MKVNILGKTYTISFVKRDRLTNDYGECNDEKQHIKVRKDIHRESQAEVLLHEVLHAIDFAVNTGLKEEQVHALATGLIAVFYNNPDFVEWICQRQTKRGS